MKDQKKKAGCIGIIMDGNRRWAKENGLTSFEGHEKGYQKMRDVVTWAQELGVKHIIFYAFSLENWNRDKKEVAYLMDLILRACDEFFEELKEKGLSVKFSGRLELLPEKTQKRMQEIGKNTKKGGKGTVTACVSYGGRQEIVDAVNRVLKRGVSTITEELIGKELHTSAVPDPDIIIRTSGEQRLSNFLTWQSVYSELFFVTKHWPDFSREMFEKILSEYNLRERRFGR